MVSWYWKDLFLKRTPKDTSKTYYTNDAMGRPLKKTQSDGTLQVLAYDNSGNPIEQIVYDKSGKIVMKWLIGYCGFDKKGNYLKSISISPPTQDMVVDSQAIEYY
jgi:YD repeat-containing protein